MYRCSECNRPIGLMADANGNPVMYKCPRTGRIAQPQLPIKRATPPPPKEQEPLMVTIRRWLPGDE